MSPTIDWSTAGIQEVLALEAPRFEDLVEDHRADREGKE